MWELDHKESCCCCCVASVVSNSVRPHRWQPIRLPHPWGSPGKNTGVDCHFLLQCMKVKSQSEVASVMSDSVRPHERQPTRLPRPWDSTGKNTGVSCHFLLQCMKVKSQSEVAQSCPTLSNPMDWSLPGSSVQGFSRQEYWSGLPFPSPGGLPDPGIEPRSPALQADALPSKPPGKIVKWYYFWFSASIPWILTDMKNYGLLFFQLHPI